MTSGEFVAAVRRGRVEFESSRLAAPGGVCFAVGHLLESLLRPDEIVHYAYQISGLQSANSRWSGEVVWLLILDAGLLLVSGQIEGTQDGRGTLRLSCRFMRRDELRSAVVESEYQETTGHVHLAAVTLRISFDTQDEIKVEASYPDEKVDGVVRLGRELRRLLDNP